MCTVTFIPRTAEKFVLTSNRDEAPNRLTISPKIYEMDNTRLLFPKDKVAGGSWIGIGSLNRMVCLMNGGFTSHIRKNAYRMSRGIIVTDLLRARNAVQQLANFDFEDIEPFTLVLVDWEKELRLFELVWDGVNAHFNQKPLMPYIWSSSLLYTAEVKQQREEWFSAFLKISPQPTQEELIRFHKTAGDGNKETSVIMDRGFVKTKSITQVVKSDVTTMRYEDLELEEISTVEFN